MIKPEMQNCILGLIVENKFWTIIYAFQVQSLIFDGCFCGSGIQGSTKST